MSQLPLINPSPLRAPDQPGSPEAPDSALRRAVGVVTARLYASLSPRSRRVVKGFFFLSRSDERLRYALLGLNHELLRRLPRYQPPAHAVRSVLFVCYGNVMRSAFAAHAFQRAAGRAGLEIAARSAGTNARPGRGVDPRARASAASLGIDLDGHRARLVDHELLHDADLVVAMDYQNAAILHTRFPDARGRIVMLGAFDTPAGESPEIVDPFEEEPEFTTRLFERIDRSVERMVHMVKRG